MVMRIAMTPSLKASRRPVVTPEAYGADLFVAPGRAMLLLRASTRLGLLDRIARSPARSARRAPNRILRGMVLNTINPRLTLSATDDSLGELAQIRWLKG